MVPNHHCFLKYDEAVGQEQLYTRRFKGKESRNIGNRKVREASSLALSTSDDA